MSPAPESVRFATWNVNSIRSRTDAVLDWIERRQPDVLLLQETKCRDEALPILDLESRGYALAHHGIDHWNGVAIVSRVGLDDVSAGFRVGGEPHYPEARIISATCAGVRVHSLYVPNGRELDDPHYLYKLEWLARLRTELAAELATGSRVLAAGDFNVAPTDLDIYDPRRWRRQTHASPPERSAVDALIRLGLCDVVRDRDPSAGLYTWWSYRPGQFEANRGLRIDLALLDPLLAQRVTGAWVDRDERGRIRPSDHAPVVVDVAAP